MENAGRILLMPKGDYSASTTYAMLDIVNHSGASWVCKQACTGQTPSDSNTAYWQRLGTAVDLSNYLQKSGGTVGNSGRKIMSVKSLDGNASSIGFEGVNGLLGELGVSDIVSSGTPFFKGNDGTTRIIFYEGNKPTGTYTGNGDATTRTIQTSGTGSIVRISGNGYSLIVTTHGAFGINYAGGSMIILGLDVCSFTSGVLTISSSNGAINNSGTNYSYQVL